MEQTEHEPAVLLSVSVLERSPGVLNFFAKIGDPVEVTPEAVDGNGLYTITEPSPEVESEAIEKSLALAKREVERNRAFQRASNFSKAYWILQLEQIRTATRARNVSIYLVNPRGTLLKPEYWFGDWSDEETPRTFKVGQGIAGKVWESGKIYISEGNVQDDPHFDLSQSPRSKQVHSLLTVPIFDFDNHIIGVMNLDSYLENRFNTRVKWRLEHLQSKAYIMLKELGVTDKMQQDELLSSFFWIFQKAINQDYVIEPQLAKSSKEKSSNGIVYTKGMRGKEDSAPIIDPSHVEEVFSAIREELSPGTGKPGPSPIRLDRLWSVFQGRENEPIPLDDFEQAFGDSSEPRKSAASAVSWLNNTLRRWGFDMEIETIHCTKYRLKQRSDIPELR